MARPFRNLPLPRPLFCEEVVNRIKAIEDVLALLGGAEFVYRNNTAEENPGAGNFRLDNALKGLSTATFISIITAGGQDVEEVYEELDIGDHLIFIQVDDRSRNFSATITGITDNATWFDIEYTVDVDNGLEFQNNRAVQVVIVKQ